MLFVQHHRKGTCHDIHSATHYFSHLLSTQLGLPECVLDPVAYPWLHLAWLRCAWLASFLLSFPSFLRSFLPSTFLPLGFGLARLHSAWLHSAQLGSASLGFIRLSLVSLGFTRLTWRWNQAARASVISSPFAKPSAGTASPAFQPAERPCLLVDETARHPSLVRQDRTCLRILCHWVKHVRAQVIRLCWFPAWLSLESPRSRDLHPLPLPKGSLR